MNPGSNTGAGASRDPEPNGRTIIRLPLVLACWLTLLGQWDAAAGVSREYEIKAVLLLNLARFVDWPATAFRSPEAPIVIGVVGRDPFGAALDEALTGEKISGRKIIVERYANAASAKPCHLLFISGSEGRRVGQILAAEHGKPVLTVSELPEFTTRLGGMVRLYNNEQNKVRLEVNLEQVKAENLKLSSKLLQVAEITKS